MSVCGPSRAETSIQGDTQSLAMSLQGDFQNRFANQSQLLQNLNNSLTPIVAAGPNQQGFSPEELSARNTQAINNAGAASRNAQQFANSEMAGQGVTGIGTNSSGLESGIQRAVKGGIAGNSANQLANAQNAITQENYATGRSNYEKGVAGLESLSGQYDPTGYSSAAQSGLGASFGEADKINSQNQALGKGILGGVMSLGKTALGFATGGLGNLASGGANAGSNPEGTDTSGFNQFFSGGLDALNNG